jgi:hypothetical protein
MQNPRQGKNSDFLAENARFVPSPAQSGPPAPRLVTAAGQLVTIIDH